MSTQMCIVCDQCGTHAAAGADPWQMMPGEWLRALPNGWFVHREAEDIAVWTFCSPACIADWADSRG